MRQPNTHSTRLQAIRDQWQSEPLQIDFPDIGIQNPTTCDQFIRCWRTSTAFAAGDDQTKLNDRAKEENLEHFGVENPDSVLNDLGRQFASAVDGKVDVRILKNAFVILDVFRADCARSAEQYASMSDVPGAAEESTSEVADSNAAARCLSLIAALADELGISLPVSKGSLRNK